MSEATPTMIGSVEGHVYKFNITMTCGGCSGAVDRVLKKLDGSSFHPAPLCDFASSQLDGGHELEISDRSLVYSGPAKSVWMILQLTHDTGVRSYTVSLDDQTASVIAEPTLEYETVLNTIKKTGKKVNSAEVDGVEKSVE